MPFVTTQGARIHYGDRDTLARELEPLFGHDLADQPAIAMTQLGATAAYDASDRLGRLVSIPTLVVSARNDLISRAADGPALAAAIPGARFVEIADAGHGVPIHAAATINDLLAAHLSSAAGQATGTTTTR